MSLALTTFIRALLIIQTPNPPNIQVQFSYQAAYKSKAATIVAFYSQR